MNQPKMMHPRIATNYAKNGYYPTDDETLIKISHILRLEGNANIFDPCCGEGTALLRIKELLESQSEHSCKTYGIELDSERAGLSRDKLDHVVLADVESCILQKKGVGLLFLNPPYGEAIKDQFSSQKVRRLEEVFFDRTIHSLQDFGVLVLVVPIQSLSKSFINQIATRFYKISVMRAAVETFNQLIIFANKIPQKNFISQEAVSLSKELLQCWADGADELLNILEPNIYLIPESNPKANFRPFSHEVSAEGLSTELSDVRKTTLWPQMHSFLNHGQHLVTRRPLCALGRWHTALALAAGQVGGVVTSKSGRKLLIKGNTRKIKLVTSTEDADQNGSAAVTVHLDRFVPVIKAIDLTKNSLNYGEVITIK